MISNPLNRALPPYDVTVIGGGTAGVFAAICAARTGAKTLLVEKNAILGGTMTAAGVNFPGLFFAWGKQIIDGPCWEAIKRTEALGGANIPPLCYHPPKHWQQQILLNKTVFTHVLNEMCRESGVHVLANTMLSYAEESDTGVSLLLTDKNGLLSVDTAIAVDATGDANLAELLGFPCERGEILQPATLQNRISGYRFEDVSVEMIEQALAQVPCKTEVPLSAKRLHYFLKTQKIDIHTSAPNGHTSAGKTEIDRRALADVMEVYQFFRTVPTLQELTIDWIAEETGIRETNRIVGEATVTAEDYISGTAYQDAVCYAFYPIDMHVMEGIRKTYHEEGVVAQIPYGSLIPKGARRILVAGRCLSSDRFANSGLRVEAPCMAMGQAAGCAAALCAKQNINVTSVDINALRASLSSLGAVLPQ